MRKVRLPVILLLICSTFGYGQSSERQGRRLTGAVRSVREETARLLKHSGQVSEGVRVLIESLAFDLQGNLIEQVGYKPDGSLNWKGGWAHTYDNEDKEIQKIHYNAEGAIIGMSVYAYDGSGKKSSLIRYNPDDSVNFRREYIYDGKGTIKEEFDRNADGSLRVQVVYVYNDKGQLAERNHYSPDEPLPHRFLYTYDEYGNIASFTGSPSPGVIHFQEIFKYDSRGNLRKRVFYGGGSQVKNVYSGYEFDAFGNWIKRRTVRTSHTNGTKQIENEIAYRTITYF
jgi:hypothetical protein